MYTFFYFGGQVVESIDCVLSENDSLIRAARLSYDLGCKLKDIFWSIGDDWASAFD